MRTGARIPEWAERYVGILYVPHGRDPSVGLDCWGLVVHIFREEFQIELPEYNSSYADEAEVDEAVKIAEGEMLYRRVDLSDVRMGDVAFFSSLRDVLHTAVMVTKREFLHCNSHTTFSTIERLDDPIWKPRLIGIFRHQHLERSE